MEFRARYCSVGVHTDFTFREERCCASQKAAPGCQQSSARADRRYCRALSSIASLSGVDGCAGHPTNIHSILSAVAVGRVDVDDAAAALQEISSGLTAIQPKTEPTLVLNVAGMQPQQIAAALESIARRQQTAAARNVSADVYAAVRKVLPGVKYHAGAQMLMFTDAKAMLPASERLPGRVAIVCGFTSDLRSAFEAKVALGLMGGYSTMYQGISAADLPSVIQLRSALNDVDAVIVCCGEQPALAGLLSSLVSVPVVALPSAGRADPITAFDVAGVSAVAPDDGVAAAAVASRTLRVAAQYIQHRKDREELAYSTEMGADELSGESDASTIDEDLLSAPNEALPARGNVPS